ncbi:MAG: hypothetical protein V7K58_28540 [Nostoc sp.]
MNDDTQPENSDQEKFDPVTDERDWSAAETELACFALARSKGKRLVNHQYQKTTYAIYLFVFLRITPDDTCSYPNSNYHNHSHTDSYRRSLLATV